MKDPNGSEKQMKDQSQVPTVAHGGDAQNFTEVAAKGQAANSVLLPTSPPGVYVSDPRLEELARDYEVVLRDHRPVLTERMIQKRIQAMKVLVGNTRCPQTPADPLIGATVRMKVNKAGKVRQDKSTIKGHKWSSLQDRVAWRIRHSGIGDKADGTAVFSAQFMLDGSSKKINAAAVWWLDVDIDSKVDPLGKVLACVLRTPEQYEDFISWAHSLGACDGYSSASHDPDNGRFHAKLHFPLSEPISYLERACIGYEFRLMIAERYGIEVTTDKIDKVTRKRVPTHWACIDPVAERGVQLNHNPRTRDMRRWSLHRSFPNISGNLIDLSALRARARARLDAERQLKAENEALRAQQGAASPEAKAQEKVALTALSERQKRAAGKLAKHGQAESGNHGDDHTFQAILIGIKCGLALEEYMPLLLDWDDDNDPPWGEPDLRAYAERVYAKSPEHMMGCALPPVAPRDSVQELLGGLVEFELGGEADEVREDSIVAAGGVHQNFLIKEQDGNFGGPPNRGRLELRGGGTIPRPKHVTVLDTPVLPKMTRERLRCRVTLIDSPCCTQKTRSLIPLIEEFKAAHQRVVGVVPSQSLSASQSTDFGIASHLGAVVHWEGSLVTCFDSVFKIKLSTWVGGDLDGEGKVEELHPIALVFFDELNEINDLRTGKTLRDVHRCDLVQGKLEEMAQDPNTRWIFQTAHMDPEAMAFVLNDIFGWAEDDVADYEIIHNTRQVLTPDVFIGHDPEKLIEEIVQSLLAGRRAICFTSTKLECEDIGRQAAIRVMHHRACMDVAVFCGDNGEEALEPPDRLKDLQAELAKVGKSIEKIRPRVLLINADQMTMEAQDALKDPKLLRGYDLIVHTSSIRSGFNIDDEMDVFARLVEGAGPAAESNHQAVLRCRRPANNRIRLCITGSAPIQSQDWKDHHTILTTRSADTADLLKGISTFREARRDGTKYLVVHNPMLVEAEARRRARIERQTHIADRFDEDGKLIQAGAQAQFWQGLRWNVYFLHEQEVQNSWSVPLDLRKEEGKKRKARRKSIRKAGDGKVAVAGGMDKETADKMKRTSRLPEIRRQVKNAHIRWRYALEEITAEDVEWDHKHWHEVLAYSVLMAFGADKSKVVDTLAEKEGPIFVCQRHEAVKAAIAWRFLQAIGLGDLEAYAASGKSIPSLGLYLSQNPAEMQACATHFNFRLWDCDLEGTTLTRKFLGMYGIEFDRRQKQVNGEKVWYYYIRPSSLATMAVKSKASIQRLLDPEQAEKQWEQLEQAMKSKASSMVSTMSQRDMQVLLEAILADYAPAPPSLSVGMG